MGEIKFIKKDHLGSGNFEYTYQCFCSPKPLKEIKVVAGNDNEGKSLAQDECDKYCEGNTQAVSSHNKVLSVDDYLKLTAQTQKNVDESFSKTIKATVEEMDESTVKITPWVSGVGCLCEHALKVAKDYIEAIIVIDKKVSCCNQSHDIVEVKFKDEKVISLTEAFNNIIEAIKATSNKVANQFAGQQRLNLENQKFVNSTTVIYSDILKTRASAQPDEAWDHIEELYLEGAHGHSGTSDSHHRFTLNDSRFKYEWNQELVKKDNDTGWSFIAHSYQDIEWSLWANNCMFSCDEITLRIMYRVVPV